MKFSSAFRLLQAVLVVALLETAQQAHGQLLLLQMKGWITHTPEFISSKGVAVTYSSTEKLCFDSGGVPASDPNLETSNRIRYYLHEAGMGPGLSFYTGSSAQPTPENPNGCAELVESTTETPNSANCIYRWGYGFYDAYSYMGEQGTAYWKGLYYTTGASQVLNLYTQSPWNNTRDEPKRYPRGYYYTINGYGSASMQRMDVPPIPKDNDPNPIALYMVVCEVQMYPRFSPTTSRMPQPIFVNGFKTLTWAQAHWWVIFIIVALVLIFLLIAIIIYCCITSIKPKEEPPVYSMVLRERIGKVYVLADGPQKTYNDNSQNFNNGAYMEFAQMSAGQRAEQQAQAEKQRRLGRGFSPQEQRNVPEDSPMGVIGIFGSNDRNLYSDGDAVGNSNYPQNNSCYPNSSGYDLHEDELQRVSGQSQQQEDVDSTSRCTSVTASRRKSGRRTRGRAISQTFDDVDLPHADEINEMNVDL
ncbi:hypothetical protein ABL78_1242 [Leptomonas seymouri]|uniref:Uncharacterized protein n=1 Tax=Leptomonas seymouri TaxID=5684 RepID=A0A0N1I2I6_LEPSE|nr:hypothetical protein ABL78_1242 [Leptomonas seymouri]|eukprot:KPI89661.1 hypothetical protein ABL78_1242 [Leptomonas seymouri]